MSRLDTSLEAAGAEFLVLGNLLIEGIEAHKSYTNFPGYDIMAVDPEKNTSCRIQVKSRWATDFDGGFPIRNLDCDFVVFVALNRGYRYRRKLTEESAGRGKPSFYVFPIKVIEDARDPDNAWGKVFLKHIEDSDKYISAWKAVREFLSASRTASVSSRT
ncbi:MAG: hypothetical protein M3518_09155 [Actinomycetota bacterium]|nr:hypothetical protein [Actinomycetota bacterium]